MFDTAWRPGVDFAAGLTAFYAKREAHHRKLADAAHREWQEHFDLALKYSLLAEEAAVAENLAA